MGPGARHITKSSKDVGVVRCVGDIGQDWVGLGRGLCRSRREGNFIIRFTCLEALLAARRRRS